MNTADKQNPEANSADQNPEAQTAEDNVVDMPETDSAEAAAAYDKADTAEKTEVETLQDEVASLKDKYVRMLADMENLRKRAAKEAADARQYAATNFARDVLSIADNLERAMDALKESEGTDKAVVEGLEMTLSQFKSVMEQHNIKRVPSVGEKLNPELHQAMFEVPTNEHPQGVIVQEMQAGYTIGGRLLRPALVGTAKPTDTAEKTEDKTANNQQNS